MAMNAAGLRSFFESTDSFEKARTGSSCAFHYDAMGAYSIVGGYGPKLLREAAEAVESCRAGRAPQDVDRSLGCVLGNVVGDALGAPLEFSPVRYGASELRGMDHEEIWRKGGYNSFGLKPGQWTDDASMGLCVVDSLLVSGEFNGLDLRQRFHGWNAYGYNNAFGRDATRRGRGSVGLGGNISQSIAEWSNPGRVGEATKAGNMYTSGNGSVMRNGGVPVFFRKDVEAGMSAAYRQSKTTHGGDEAAELCRLLTYVCTQWIQGAPKSIMDDLTAFSSPSYAVTCMRDGKCEERHEQNSDPIFGGLERRQWNWKDKDFQYCEHRASTQPGYVGSYAMDAVSMALHCVYHTGSFEEATLRCANLRGDSDSVCAVVGQLAGALYGASAIPPSWLSRVQKWDGGGTIAARALLLYRGEKVGDSLGDDACRTALLLGTPAEA